MTNGKRLIKSNQNTRVRVTETTFTIEIWKLEGDIFAMKTTEHRWMRKPA